MSKSEKILIVEDNEINSKVLTSFLKKRGYVFDLANNGIEALSLCEKTHYQLILMDCQMPQMDGFETSRKILEKYSHDLSLKPVIVALTANAMKGDREKCLASGMDDYMAKPVDFDLLTKILKQYLGDPPNGTVIEAHRSKGAPLRESAFQRLKEMESPDDPHLTRDIIRLYLETAPSTMAQLAESVKGVNRFKIREIAHKFKSSCLTLGADVLAEKMKKLENECVTLTTTELKQLLAEANSECRSVCEQLEQRRKLLES